MLFTFILHTNAFYHQRIKKNRNIAAHSLIKSIFEIMDDKHVGIEFIKLSGSLYSNYKEYFSITL